MHELQKHLTSCRKHFNALSDLRRTLCVPQKCSTIPEQRLEDRTIDNKTFILLFNEASCATVTATQPKPPPPRIVSAITKSMATMHMTRPTSPYNSSSSETDSIIANVTPTGTALRRLYFKSAKTSKMNNSADQANKNSSTPKAIVMNSSCNSTINTSTESASTHLTNITTTTDTETCDSLDLGK